MHKFKDNEADMATFDKVYPILHDLQMGWVVTDEAKMFSQFNEIS